MIVDKRIHDVLDAIVSDPSITGVELEAQFKLTRKQLSYTIQKINDYLQSNQFEPITRLKTGKLCVPKPVIDNFRNQQEPMKIHRYLFSEDERTHLIVFFLLTRSEKLSLIHLSSSLMVSQNTIINDIKKVQSILSQYHMQVNYDRENGYRIAGTEIDKRHLLLKIVRKILNMPVAQKIFLQHSSITVGRLEHIGQVFSEIEKRLKIQFTDQQLQELTYFIGFILQRIEMGKTIKQLPDSYIEAEDSRDFALVQKLIEKFGITQRKEQIFLTVLVQSSNIQTVSDKDFHIDTVLLKSVITVVDNFEQISCITFKDKGELIERIYQHWKPAYYRIRYHISNVNSVYDIVLQEFGHLHEMVRRAIAPFETMLHCEIPDEEAAFLTVLFGGWLTREGMINQIKTKKIAIVVCENSATVSTYLYLTLQVLLPELHFAAAMSKREFEKYNRYYDVVFSTTALTTDKLLFTINPSLTSFHKNAFRSQVISALQGVDPNIIQIEDLMFIIEKYGIIHDRKNLQKDLLNYLYQEEHQDLSNRLLRSETPSLSDLLPLENIHITEQPDIHWERAIALASEPVIATEQIQEYYVERMVNKIHLDHPYIMLVDGLIIAHAGIEDGVNQVCMSLLRLPEKIDICGYMQADLIIVLATNNPQKHLKALAQLNEFLEFHDGATKIRQAKDRQDIRALFNSYQ
ncbi:BglG family transcription antiterminator [Zophobihabitans entericus]|uniref:Ascorbate-specific PTS system EIIA component n=1 Tax=Zophobihabitans entericus TaxID=1635327 RepID=A0A6G9I9F2_9GAMM|nr:BglG family transcription antiterminator [Zophobihabitans entericus]QIQ20459.1 BglG family transcription antiterminator [Zophobihabitans entericus]